MSAPNSSARDSRIEQASAHWSHRMVTNGVPLADFQDVTGTITSWNDWCSAWVERGGLHEGLGRNALDEGWTLTAGEHLTTAAACYHFAKFLFDRHPLLYGSRFLLQISRNHRLVQLLCKWSLGGIGTRYLFRAYSFNVSLQSTMCSVFCTVYIVGQR